MKRNLAESAVCK